MSAVLVIVLAVTVAVVVAGVLYTGLGRGGAARGGLRRRFGPEYDRAVTRHAGDTRAAERELAQRVRTYGSFTPHPLPPEVREQYLSRWTSAQERFVDSPRQALAEVHELLGGLAQARGFPGPERREEHLDALSVHHPQHLGGYRRLHAAATSGAAAPSGTAAGTEEMREAMLQARAFFDALATEQPHGPQRGAAARAARTPRAERPLTHDGALRGSLLPGRRHTKGNTAP
ncbi:hypothetical protein [Streptomyces nanshensis]|uniref:Secreted protein n=1 Tax=Streptomyces nanshensis TaxID=518642 RepID=A0A1E7L202_9ACTN|nr:hypothetical protein [Streptomyces nanshensis]OEV10182.1 hypothetical protein AN218_18670 [Streptomyces nanshensis]